MVGPSDALAVRREYREWKKERRGAPEARIAHRQKIKDDISANLERPERDRSPEAIIRDLARMDDYPDVDDSITGISPWFKVEVKGLYHRGLEVLIKLASVEFVGREARESSEGEETIAVVGRIPFDAIVLVDWSGDEYYPQPHLYCWFDQEDGPYEAVEVYRLPNKRGYWEHLDQFRFKGRKVSLFRRWRLNRDLKKAQKKFEREYAGP